jgi:glycosyltransferase involved in cell wall biosynthesis
MAYAMLYFDGYGIFVSELIRALDQSGRARVHPMLCTDWDGFPGWMHPMRRQNFGNLTISVMPPHELQDIPGRQWVYTMTEGTEIPDLWVEKINRLAERVIVPSEWLVDVFQSRVRPPVHVVPGGVNPAQFPIVSRQRPPDQPFTFLVFGDRAGRKAWDMAWMAFTQEFAAYDLDQALQAWYDDRKVPPLEFTEPVRMVVKVRPGGLQFVDTTKLNGLVRWSYQARHMADVYPLADCVVVPSRAEGWGFFAREATCMGIPTIVGDWSGHHPDASQWATVPLQRYTQVKAYQESLGDWFEPDTDELAWAMRWVYDNQEEARTRARNGAQWLRDNQTWQHTVDGICELLEQYA